jgi:hypothetical protein
MGQNNSAQLQQWLTDSGSANVGLCLRRSNGAELSPKGRVPTQKGGDEGRPAKLDEALVCPQVKQPPILSRPPSSRLLSFQLTPRRTSSLRCACP